MPKDPEDLLTAAGARISGRRAAVRRVIAGTPSEKRAQTQAAILAAGREVVAEKGIGAMSVGDLCSRAGFTRGAFYSNFTDMDHFVRRLAEEQWNRMAEFVHDLVTSAINDESGRSEFRTDAEVTDAVADLADRFLASLPMTRDFYLLQEEFAAYVIRDEEHAPSLRDSYAAFKASLCEILVAGLAALGRECLLSPEDTTEIISAAAERSMRVALMRGDEALTGLLDRSLPELLAHLSVPATR